MVSRIDIAMVPAEASVLEPADAYVVIDTLRATTTIAALFAGGIQRLRVVTRLEAAFQAKSKSGALLFGEVGGLPPAGFDFGNSPVEAEGLDVRGRDAILMTSNGTKALCAVAGLGPTATGALVNVSEVAAWAASADSVVLVCAGNHGARAFSLEDFAVAAAIVKRLVAASPAVALGDAGRLALTTDDPARLIRNAEHAGVIRGLGLGRDVEFATDADRATSLPVVLEFGDGWAVLEDRRAAG
ncbi:MAG: 2-phosphosulfolactate phosphatase [Dehalococcoidia bacterium]